ncbi:MAG: hypothetical protein ACRD5H_01265, partial [Nitrososphaerales archaeon]
MPELEEPYQSLFTPQEQTSPVTSVLANTERYGGAFPAPPTAPTLPARRGLEDLNIGQKIGLMLQSFGAGLEGKASPIPAVEKELRAQHTEERRDALEAFRVKMEAYKLGREAYKETRKESAQDRIRAGLDPEQFQKDPTTTMLKMIPDLLEVDPNAATSIFNLAQKAHGDTSKRFAARIAGNIISQATDPKTGEINAAAVSAGMATVGDPDVMEAIKGFMPLITEQGRETRFQQGETRREAQQVQQAAQFQQTFGRIMSQFAQSQADINRRDAEHQAALREERERLDPTDKKILRGNVQAIGLIDAYKASHENFMAVKGQTPISATLKGGLIKNSKAKAMTDVAGLTGGNPAEYAYAAEYNAVIAGLRTLTDEAALSQEDAIRNLQSFDPLVHPDQFRANLKARRSSYERSWRTTVDALRGQGKNTRGYDYESELGVRARETATKRAATIKLKP